MVPAASPAPPKKDTPSPSPTKKRFNGEPVVWLNQPKQTVDYDGKPWKPRPEYNYCHMHFHNVITYRIAGQMWGGENMTAYKFWDKMNGCGQTTKREFHPPDSKCLSSSFAVALGIIPLAGQGCGTALWRTHYH